MLNQRDLTALTERGISPEQLENQLSTLRKGIDPADLIRPCTIGDGIEQIDESAQEELVATFRQAASEGRVTKFVPASGAATRMFKSLMAFLNDPESNDRIQSDANRFVANLDKFAFADDLQTAANKKGLDWDQIKHNNDVVAILGLLLESDSLGYGSLPKGLIKFHSYSDGNRTALDEHLEEAIYYAKDSAGKTRVHFTVASAHQDRVEAHIASVRSALEQRGCSLEISYSKQKSSTDTVALDANGEAFRDDDGTIHFRPGGHGALLENLNDLNGDIVFIKNVDNVVPDRLKPETYLYKELLGGYLLKLQGTVFKYLNTLDVDDLTEEKWQEMYQFATESLYADIASDTPGADRKDVLYSIFNRPLRVCAMVKNEGEPGGGPFWVKDQNGRTSLQIVETSQIDLNSSEQKEIHRSATHFNPVDLVCGLSDYRGNQFELAEYRDPESGFVSEKSRGGRDLKALELPGLWNGAMAHWNTIFIEVPIITFNPVKTIFDLLRDEHQ